MKEIHQVSRFHKAGQGLFYSATFCDMEPSHKKEIRYIIDSGAHQSYVKDLYNEIDTYIDTFKDGGVLEFLILSHLHFDHVSGLEKLLNDFSKKNITINNIVLPYFEKATRIYLYTQWKLEKINAKNKWYLEFLSQPIVFLKKYKIIKNIIIIHSSDEHLTGGDTLSSQSIVNDPPLEIRGDLVIAPSNDELENASDPGIFNIKNCMITLYKLIEFDFWYKEVNQATLKEFKEYLKDVDLGKALKNIKNSKLYKAYKTLHTDFNDTSLCVSITADSENLFSSEGFLLSDNQLLNQSVITVKNFKAYGFDERKSIEDIRVKYKNIRLPINKCNPYRPSIELDLNFGYLFTGDINLGPNKSGTENANFVSFIKHYIFKGREIGTLIIPHHGSQSSWDPRLLDYFINPFCVISSGIANQYRHPDFLVVNDLYSRVGWVWSNNKVSFDHGFILRFKQ